MNIVLTILGVLALVVIATAALRPPGARLPHFKDDNLDGAPDLSEAERRKAMRDRGI